MTKRIEDVTFCTAYWTLQGNSKRPVEHYLAHIPESLKLIRGGKLVLFHDDPAVEERFRRVATGESIDFTAVKVPLAELPTARHGNAFLAACREMNLPALRKLPRHDLEKGLRHHERDLLGSGEDVYRALISIWTSKVPLMRRIADAGLYNTSHYAWIDASIARFNLQRENWLFTDRAYGDRTLYHYGSPMYYRGEMLPLNASFLLATRSVWVEVEEHFTRQMVRLLSDPYAHDEETILAEVHREHPELFTKIGDPYRTASPPRSRARSIGRVSRALVARYRALVPFRSNRRR